MSELTLLAESDIDEGKLASTLDEMMDHRLDFAEVFLQSSRSESWGLEDGIVKDGSFSVDAGLGVRALAGEKTGFAYAEEFSVDGLAGAANAAKSIASGGGSRRAEALKIAQGHSLYPKDNPIEQLDELKKVELLKRVDAVARAADPRVKEVNVRIAANHEAMMVVATDGTHAVDVHPQHYPALADHLGPR